MGNVLMRVGIQISFLFSEFSPCISLSYILRTLSSRVSRRHRIVLHDQSINQTISVPPSKVRQVPAEDFWAARPLGSSTLQVALIFTSEWNINQINWTTTQHSFTGIPTYEEDWRGRAWTSYRTRVIFESEIGCGEFVRGEGRDIDREGSQNRKFLITVENEKKRFSGEDTIATPNLWIELAKPFGNQLDDNRNTNRISKKS